MKMENKCYIVFIMGWQDEKVVLSMLSCERLFIYEYISFITTMVLKMKNKINITYFVPETPRKVYLFTGKRKELVQGYAL